LRTVDEKPTESISPEIHPAAIDVLLIARRVPASVSQLWQK
jgi:hypothetical protein